MSNLESQKSGETSSTTASVISTPLPPVTEKTPSSSNLYRSFVDSFKRHEPDVDPETLKNLSEAERSAIILQSTPLKKSLKNRHLQMIAIGGSIGTGLFVGSGTALRTGGAASLPICWSIVGGLIFCVIHALGELQVTFPVNGAFSAHASRFIDPSFGFAVGWGYVILWLVVLPAEIIAAAMTIGYWNDDISPVAWVGIFYVLIMAINLFGVRGYGEAEFVMALIKVVAIVGFLILGVVLVCGGGPSGGFVGGKYYHDPGAFTNGFKGVCTVFVTATYSIGGAELVGLAASEAANPRKTMPSAIKQVFWRITLFYIGSLTLISLLVSADDERLLGSSSVDASASPFVIAIKNGGIKGLPSVMNVVILISVLSVGNSAVYGCSRTISSLAAQGLAPEWFNYVDRMGRPIFGIALNGLTGLLCFLVASSSESVIFTWLMALCGLAIVFTWMAILISHIRFRLAMKVQGRSLDELPFKAHSGFWGSVIALIVLVLFLIAQFWVALYPLGASPDPSAFFEAYLGAVVFLVLYIGRKIWKRKFWEFLPLKEIPLDPGRSHSDIELLKLEMSEERELLKTRPLWYRAYKFLC